MKCCCLSQSSKQIQQVINSQQSEVLSAHMCLRIFVPQHDFTKSTEPIIKNNRTDMLVDFSSQDFL